MDTKKTNPLQDAWEKVKKFWLGLAEKTRKLIIVSAVAVLAITLVIFLALQLVNGQYKTLYSGLDSSEASTVYSQLQGMGVSPQMDANGNIRVPASSYDSCLLQLAESGYPQSALTYDLFSDHSGLTSTETQQKQWIIYQLQDRLQSTLCQIDGVNGATVTITIPDTSDYVWDQATENDDSTASVLLTLRGATSLSTSQVTAIKNLVASATPKLDPANVTVVNAATMLEMSGDGESTGSAASMECEQLAQKQIEENIVRLLTPRYGSGGVVAVAKVALNYDKMMTEKMELLTQPTATDGTGGGGYTTHTEGSYNLDGSVTAGDIVGEENNTDIPNYAYNEAGTDDSMTDYSWSKDLDYGYIKTQIEKGNAVIDSATVSVLVNDDTLASGERDELISLVSKSTNIAAEDIFISTFEKPEQASSEAAQPVISPAFSFAGIPLWILVAIGAGALLLLILLGVLSHRRKTKKKRAQLAERQRLKEEEEERRQKMEQEIASYKKQLSDAANSGMDEKNEAIVKDVRNFAKENPAIAANLLRSWLKDGEN